MDIRSLYPAILSAVAIGAVAGFYSGYAGGRRAFWRGYWALLLGWALFVASRGLVGIVLLPLVLVEVVVGSFLPFAAVYICFRWFGAAVEKRASTDATEKSESSEKSDDSPRLLP